MLRSASMQPEKRAAFVKVFSTLKQNVIWKFNDAIDDFTIKCDDHKLDPTKRYIFTSEY